MRWLAMTTAALALALAGCGSGDEPDRPPPAVSSPAPRDVEAAFPPNVVRTATISEHDEGTPERALLEWWQAFQFRDVQLVKDLIDPAVLASVGEARMESLVRRVGHGLQGIEVLGARTSGDDASVRLALLSFAPRDGETAAPSEPTGRNPTTLVMRRAGGDWVVADGGFLRQLARNSGL